MAGNVVSNVKKYYGGQVPVPGQGDNDGKVKVLVEKTATIEIGGVQTEVELLYDADDLTTPVTPQQLGQWTDENYLIAFKKREDDGRVRGFILYALETDSTSTDTLVNRAEFISFKEDMAHEPGASAYEFTMVEDSSTLNRYLRDENGELIVKFDKASVEEGAQSDTLANLIGTDSDYINFEVVHVDDNAYLILHTENLDNIIEDIYDYLVDIWDIVNALPSDEHGYFNSSLITTPGDGTTTNIVIDDFRISQGGDVHGESIEFVPTHQEGGIDFGEVYLNPGTYIFTVHYTLQWVGNPRGTFLPLVTNVGDRPFDFSYEHEDVVRTTRIVTRTTRGKFSLGFPIDADTPPMGIWVKNLEIAQIASYNHPAVVHDTTLTGKGQLGDPLGVTPAAFGKVKDIPTSISQFRTGDVIPVDGPNGPAKMPKVDLLLETAQNALAGNVAPAFDPARTSENPYNVGEMVIYQGKTYRFKVQHYGDWTAADVTLIPINEIITSLETNVSQAFDFIVEPKTPNLFDGSLKQTPGYYDGSGVFHVNSSFRCTAPVFVKGDVKYKYPFNSSQFVSNTKVYVTNKDGEILGVLSGTIESTYNTFTPENYCYVVINIGLASDVSSFMLCEYDRYPNNYVEGKGYELNPQFGVTFDQITGVAPYKNLPAEILENRQVIDNGINLFDQSSQLIKNGYYINSSGQYASATNYWVSHPIFVAKDYSYSFNVDQLAFGANKILAYVSENDLETITDVINYNVLNDVATFTASKNGYIRFSGAVDKSTIMFSFAALFPAEYVAFHQRRLMDDILLSESQKRQLASKLSGKILSCVGDSICYGDGYAGGYCKIIGETYGMIYENLGVNGARISEYNGTTPMANRIASMRSDADYVIVEGGVNDSGNPNIGSLASGYSGPFDKTTLYGAFEQLWYNCYARFPGKKIGYIAVHKVGSFYDSLNAGADNIYKIALETCEKWGIPVCDLNNECPPFGYFKWSSGLASIYAGYTKNGDGWHPTEEGYKKYYVPKIVDWLESL